MRRPEVNHLLVFLKVVETGSFVRAGRQMNKSQPAISQVIAKLEDIFGGYLFERRRGAPLTLTPIGEAILPSARIVIDAIDRQMARAAETAQSVIGTLGVGFFPSIESGPLRKALDALNSDRPLAAVQLIEDLPGKLCMHLNDRAVDIVFVALIPEIDGNTFVQEHLWCEPLYLAVSNDHPLNSNSHIRWTDLRGIKMLVRTRQEEIDDVRTIISRRGEPPLECDVHLVSREALMQMVGMGLGCAIVSRSAARPRNDLAFLPISEIDANVDVYGLWRRDDQNPLRHRLLSHLRKSLTRDEAPHRT